LEPTAKTLYEGLFLVDQSRAAADWDATLGQVKGLLDRTDCEIVSIQKWDERKLAYPVSGRDRGTYILAFFRAAGSRIAEIERYIRLSETILRGLVLRADAKGRTDLPQAAAGPGPERKEEKAPGGGDTEEAGPSRRMGPENLEAEGVAQGEIEKGDK
jgi:small subunit ribosomal protein S6